MEPWHATTPSPRPAPPTPTASAPGRPWRWATAASRSSGSTPNRSPAMTWPGSPTASRSCWRTCSATRTALRVSAADIAAVADWGRQPERHGSNAGDDAKEIAFTPERVLMQDFTGVPGGGRPGRHARRPGRARRRPAPDQPAGPGRAGDRPLGDRRALGPARAPSTRTSTSSTERNLERYQLLRWAQRPFDGFRVVPAGHRHLPPGEPRVPVAGGLRHRRRAGLLRHPGRHRLAHHHGQRAGRARLGGGRHRGRGGHARPAALHAPAAGGRASG